MKKANSARFVAILLGFCPFFLQAQQNGNPVIVLDVVVEEKSGTPLVGLQQSDFTLLDNQVPQKILSFRGPAAAADSPAEVILLLDEVNSAYSGVSQATVQVEKFLKQNGERLALPTSLVFLTDKGLSAAAEAPTTDASALQAELHGNRAPLRVIGRTQGYYGATDRVGLSLQALGQMAAMEQARPGRKLLIWVSPGWPLLSGPRQDLTDKDERSIFHSIVSLSAELREARVTLYAVDPLGSADTRGLRTDYWEAFEKPAKKPDQVQIGDLALQVLAYQSGGLVLNGSNDVAGEIGRSFADARASYQLTFEALPADGPDDFHAIQAKVDQAKATVRTRAGYYAEPVQASQR
jgi:VWFA-related protein